MATRTEKLLQDILNELRGTPSTPSASPTRAAAEALFEGGDPEEAAAEAEALNKVNELLDERIEKLTKYHDLAKSNLEVTSDILKVEKEVSKNSKRAKQLEEDLVKQKVDALQKELALALALKEAGMDAEREVSKVKEELKAATAALEDMASEARRAEAISKTFSQLSGGLKEFVSILKGGASQLATATSMVGGLDAALSSVISLDPAAPFKAFTAVIAGAVKETDLLRANFVAMTGDANATRDTFVDLAVANRNLGIGFKEMQDSLFALREGFDDFLFLGRATRNNLNQQVAVLEKFGIQSATTVEGLNTLTQSFGMSANEAMALQRSMIGLARDLELPPRVIAEEFTKTMPALREFGDRAEDVFRRLVIASRETGLEISNITAVFGDAMNTYQGSTQAAGRLNAVLGAGIISGTELLMADTEERFRIVQRSLEMTGRSFAELGRFEQISFAQAAGFRSVDEAARAFGNTQDDLVTRIGNTAITQAEMNELAEEATDTMTKLKFAFLSVAREIKPLTDKFAEFTMGLVENAEAAGGILNELKSIAMKVAIVFTGLGLLMSVVLAPFLAGGGAIAAALAPVVGSLGSAAIGTGVTAAAGLGALSFAEGAVDDAIIKGNTVIPINSQDDILAAKSDGPVDRALGAGATRGGLSAGLLAAFHTTSVGRLVDAFTAGYTGDATGTVMGNTGDTTLVVKVMIDDRELGEAMVPHIDKRVLGTV